MVERRTGKPYVSASLMNVDLTNVGKEFEGAFVSPVSAKWTCRLEID
jgi:hypothetical protein